MEDQIYYVVYYEDSVTSFTHITDMIFTDYNIAKECCKLFNDKFRFANLKFNCKKIFGAENFDFESLLKGFKIGTFNSNLLDKRVKIISKSELGI